MHIPALFLLPCTPPLPGQPLEPLSSLGLQMEAGRSFPMQDGWREGPIQFPPT